MSDTKRQRTGMPPVDAATSNRNRLLLALDAPDDQPIGTASVFACLALVVAMVTEETKAKLLDFLGLARQEDLVSLTDPSRVLAILLSTPACESLDAHEAGDACKRLWSQLGAERIALRPDLEAQVNGLVKRVLATDDDMFAPQALVKESQRHNLIAALLSIEQITVSWEQELDAYEDGAFAAADGGVVPAIYCVDDEPRSMPFMQLEGAKAAMLVCKADAHDGKRRAMVFVLPDDADASLDATLASSASRLVERGGFRPAKVSLKFPQFKATRPPASVMGTLAKHVPELFTPDSACMRETLAEKVVGGVAYLGDVQHGASIQANRKGAVARAVTVAPVLVYRSLAPAPRVVEVHCDRPFVTLLVALDEHDDIESVEFVTKHQGAASLDTVRSA